MADTGIVTGAQLAEKSVSIKKLLARLSRSLPLDQGRRQPCSSTTYDFTHPRRGLAIIISNGKFLAQEPRPCANAEIVKIQSVFKKLCFDVLSFQDLTKKQMLSVLQDAAKLKEFHQQSDCFACVVGSHGAEVPSGLDKHAAHATKKHVIYGTDNYVDTNRLTDLFSDGNCPGLRHKPKLFFIQACRKDSTAPNESGLDIGIDINITSCQPPSSTLTRLFELYDPQRTHTRDRQEHFRSVIEDETLEGGGEFDSSKTDMATGVNDNSNIVKNEIQSRQPDVGPISQMENNTSPSPPEGNGTSQTLQENTAKCLTSTKDTGSTSPKDNDTNETKESPSVNKAFDQQPTDHVEFLGVLSKLLHLNPIIDEQVTPVCRPNFMIMYSSPQDMYSIGRQEDGMMAGERNPVVGGFLLHSLYSVVVRENLFVRQRTPEGLDILDVFTRVSDFGLKNITAAVKLAVGKNEEDKQKFYVKCAFSLEHRLVDNVIFRDKVEI